MFNKLQHIHFVGIGGIGMSGIAEILLNQGHSISGSDMKSSALTRKLKRRGAKVNYGHKATNINGAQVVVVSSAVNEKNPEIQEAINQGIPVVPRAEMLAELMRLKYGIAVAGTHGKTTTTSLIAQVLAGGNLDPTIIIGGKVNSLRSNARLGKGDYLVAEADESDQSFLKLSPIIAVITNIDPEHMENYKNFNDVRAAYDKFADKVPYYGSVVCCADHPEVRRLLGRCNRPIVTYGISNAADFTASNICQAEGKLDFEVSHKGEALGHVRLHMPGRHNVSNALAAIAVGALLEVPFKKIVSALEKFKGIERRFQVLSRKGPMVVTDYAHHPVELQAIMQAARDGWPGRRLIVVHQPHRYSRLKGLYNDFIKVLADSDVVLLTKLYAASESPISGISSKKLANDLSKHAPQLEVLYTDTDSKTNAALRDIVQKEDVVLFLGAGDIWKCAHQFAKQVESK